MGSCGGDMMPRSRIGQFGLIDVMLANRIITGRPAKKFIVYTAQWGGMRTMPLTCDIATDGGL
jgi:hypothetical protein